MGRNERLSFGIVCLIVVMSQSLDLLGEIKSEVKAVPYILHFTVDMTAFVLILVASGYHTKRSFYAILILLIQSVSSLDHIVMLCLRSLYSTHWPYDEFRFIHSYYKESLELFFYLKLVVLFSWGSHGLFNEWTGGSALPDGDDTVLAGVHVWRLPLRKVRAKRGSNSPKND